MEKVLNKFHYCVFLMLNKFHLFNNKFNPVLFLYRLPYYRKKHKEKNFDPVKVQNELWMNKKNGINLWLAEVVLGSVVMCVFISFYFIVTRTLNIKNKPWLFVIFFIAISTYITYQNVSKNDKYLSHYKNFEHWNKIKKRKYMLLSIIIIICAIALLFASIFISVN